MVSVTAASVCPSGEKSSDLTSPSVSRRGAPTGVSSARVPERDALLLESDRDQAAVGAEPPRVAVKAGRGERPVVREREGPPEAAVACEIPGDRGAVVTHRVERLPSGLKTGC